jgi:2-polyprenyl-3-methyl-5-hydroxy-6-metoxy-1,4-benzoquinol methylase
VSFERLEPGTDEWSAYLGNHRRRYTFAAHCLGGLPPASRVLDAATGVGYGAAHLAQACGVSVVAVDRDPAALRLARQHFGHDRVRFEEDDCSTLDRGAGAGAPYAAAVSFETIEHLREPDRFLRRVADLIVPGGTLIASTPNATVTTAERGSWEHHEREYTAAELQSLIADSGFESVRLFGQRLTPLGELRRDVRGEFHRMRSNPVVRLGLWLHRQLRGVRVEPPLPEREGDFAIEPLDSPDACEREGTAGPFVVIAVATRKGIR